MTAIDRPAPQASQGRLALPQLSASGWMLAGVLIVAASAMAAVFQNSSMTSQGFNLEELRAEADALRAELRLLEADVARLTSIERVARRARELDLFPGVNAIYVTVAEAGPAPPNIPAEYLPTPMEPGSGRAP